MKQCINCGAVLPAGEQDVCLVCGARQPAQDAQPAQETRHAQGEHTVRARTQARVSAKKSMNTDKLLRILLAVLAVLFVLLMAGSVATYVLSEQYDPEDFFTSFSSALLSGDTARLSPLVHGDGVNVSTEGLAALCRAFNTQDSVNGLIAQLRGQLNGDGAAQAKYPALYLHKERIFLGYATYQLGAKPVSLRVSTNAQNPLLSIEGIARTADVTSEEGLLYNNLFPGAYTCIVSGQSALGETVMGAQTLLALFDPDAPTVFNGNLPLADITVGNCLSDEAIISINGTPVGQKPTDLTVSLPLVRVGSTITMSYTQPYGGVTTASVVFSDQANTALQFEGHTTAGGAQSEEELTSLLGAFYASYLDACNSRDAARLNTCTEELRTSLSEAVLSKDHEKYIYVFQSATPQMDGKQDMLEDPAAPRILVNAMFRYQRTEKDDDDTDDATSYYTCELIYQEGWKVNRVARINEQHYNDKSLNALS